MGGSTYIPLPSFIKRKHAVVNIQNSDQLCFQWSILSALHPADHHVHRISNYISYINELHFDNIEFPMKIHDIPRFEKLNNISVNVFGVENNEIVGPFYFTKDRKITHVNLLLITDNSGNSHYCHIKNLSRLISSQINNKKNNKFICDGCLCYFNTANKLQLHQQNDCSHICVDLPSKDIQKKNFLGEYIPSNNLSFQDYHKSIQVPFVIYADFESVLYPVDHNKPDLNQSFTITTHKHKPHSFAYYIKCNYNDSLSKFELYRGVDCAQKFIEFLERDVKDIYQRYLKEKVLMHPLTQDEQNKFETASHCHICEKDFIADANDRVRDHCHLTGKFRGASHSICNLNYKIPTFIPIFFHNLSGYDSHLFIKELASENSRIDVIAQSKEKYISFTKHILVDETDDGANTYIKLRFLDSFKFMSSSLDSLANDLMDQACYNMKKMFPDDFQLMRKKSVFPYDFIDSFEKLNYHQLPDKSEFYNKITSSDIKDEEYSRAKLIWEKFHCKTLGDYSDIYLKIDVLLLADVFENFRDVCLKTYHLDPCHFFTAPGLSWSAMLRHTKINLELLTDIDMVHFFKKGVRGGVAMCMKRDARANNKFMKNFVSSKPSSYIAYLDATNLYGAAMSQPLPQSGFEWMESVDNFDVTKISDDDSTGYILEVDLEYPEHIHDIHNDLPVCPEKLVSPKCTTKVKKLIPNLYDKSNYILHYRNLKQVLSLGLKLKKINRILKFQQSTWLKCYIDLNTELRNKASNKFEKNFFKLMVNSIFGKTIENVDKRQNIKLTTSWENVGRKLGTRSLIASPAFKDCSIFDENFTAIHMKQLKVMYDKPLYLGFTILDISKLIMYNFIYNFLKPRYDKNVNILYTDTDSLILEIFTENFYNDIITNLEVYDTSNYPHNNRFKIPKTPSVLGKMKDEFPEKIIHRFLGTGAKAYTIVTDVENNDDKYEYIKKAKGVNKSVIEKMLTVEHYENVIYKNPTHFEQMISFRSNLHQISTNVVNKVALSQFDDKRLILSDKVNTLSWGHYQIRETL